jgi:MinD-like ATPase involved in chromosome partitioning or flagellar assembly
MDENAGSRAPKTLADVSHLFFSSTVKATEESPAQDVAAPGRTRLLVVTGGDDSPGKSTIAVNLAQALVPHGRVAIFDADPSVPNARYFLGLPSWHYLSPLTGGGEAAPVIATEAGVVVTDWSHSGAATNGLLGSGDVVYTDVPDGGRQALDFVVVDVPASRTEMLSVLGAHWPAFIVAARPVRTGFEHAFAALRNLRREANVSSAALVVNGASNEAHARAFHAKMRAAAGRLLSVDVRLLGAVLPEPGLGAEQRERGAIVASRPDAAVALSLRQIASSALELAKNAGRQAGASAGHDPMEDMQWPPE